MARRRQKKAATYEEFKANQEAKKAAELKAEQDNSPEARFLRSYGPLHVGHYSTPSTPAELLQQFFQLRYQGVPMRPVLKALRKAYKGEEQEIS